MTDGLGTVAYSYDPLSQMTSETREFDNTLANAPMKNRETGEKTAPSFFHLHFR